MDLLQLLIELSRLFRETAIRAGLTTIGGTPALQLQFISGDVRVCRIIDIRNGTFAITDTKWKEVDVSGYAPSEAAEIIAEIVRELAANTGGVLP